MNTNTTYKKTYYLTIADLKVTVSLYRHVNYLYLKNILQ